MTLRMTRETEWPQREVLRLEGFSDAVFAFALTLLVVSLEAPKSFDELVVMLRGTPAFAVCFTLFWVIWREHHRFFRRYGLDDPATVRLNAFLLFVVLLYVYPLKFLFTLMFGGLGDTALRLEQARPLMMIYSGGYGAVFGIFALMYRHALARRIDLNLTDRQVFETRAQAGVMLLHVTFALVSVGIAASVPPRLVGLAGWLYFLIAPAQALYKSRVHRRRARMLA